MSRQDDSRAECPCVEVVVVGSAPARAWSPRPFAPPIEIAVATLAPGVYQDGRAIALVVDGQELRLSREEALKLAEALLKAVGRRQ